MIDSRNQFRGSAANLVEATPNRICPRSLVICQLVRGLVSVNDAPLVATPDVLESVMR
jgi:hypothetical protein